MKRLHSKMLNINIHLRTFLVPIYNIYKIIIIIIITIIISIIGLKMRKSFLKRANFLLS